MENQKENENGKYLPMPPKHNFCCVNSASQSQAAAVCVVTPTLLHSDVCHMAHGSSPPWLQAPPNWEWKVASQSQKEFSFLSPPPKNFQSSSRNVLNAVFHLLIAPPNLPHSRDPSVALREPVVSPKMRESFF